MLAYPFVALSGSNKHTYCVGIELSSWSSLFASLYFALSLSFHIKYRTLLKRHFEYHSSLLELSSDHGLERTEPLSRWEKISVLTCLSAFVCAVAFVLDQYSLSTSVENNVPLQAALVTASTVTLEFLLNRFTLSFFALLEVVVLAIVFSLCTWLVNWTEDCTLFLGNRTNATWYDLHLFENVGEGKYMPYFFFVGVLVLSTAILFMFTALRFTCLAKDKDRSEHTNKIMMCAL